MDKINYKVKNWKSLFLMILLTVWTGICKKKNIHYLFKKKNILKKY